MTKESRAETWSLEVVRGADAGKKFALADGTVLLGNSLRGEPGIDLASQEVNSPRKMAARQAQIYVMNGSLTLRDLGSPGGTFVDRRRVPPGSDLPLKEGDVIQLGGVQLRVSARAIVDKTPQLSTPLSPQSSSFLFTLKGGATCRTWDDFLAISAQKWADLRDELTSGRLTAFLVSIGRSDLSPHPRALGSPDERLDAWIGRLPAIRDAKPELEVHPRTVVIRAAAGGGVTRKKIQVSNSGYRLLRATARVEPADATWLTIAPEFSRREFLVIDSMDLNIDATLPESIGTTTKAEIVFEGNGGSARVAILVEPPTARIAEPVGASSPKARISLGLRERIARQEVGTRLIAWPLSMIVARMLIAAANAIVAVPGDTPSLLGPAIGFAVLGAFAALWASRASAMRDRPSAAVTGGILGAMLAAIVIAVCRTVEAPIAKVAGSSILVACLTWAVLGAALAVASILVIPPRSKPEGKP